ncbi:MAG: nucleotide exchange factor GrpE [Nanoarchaeota archaeon]|nr:nucleotide exchange factor GrpE [Nanoarchaeota archaeon]
MFGLFKFDKEKQIQELTTRKIDLEKKIADMKANLARIAADIETHRKIVPEEEVKYRIELLREKFVMYLDALDSSKKLSKSFKNGDYISLQKHLYDYPVGVSDRVKSHIQKEQDILADRKLDIENHMRRRVEEKGRIENEVIGLEKQHSQAKEGLYKLGISQQKP